MAGQLEADLWPLDSFLSPYEERLRGRFAACRAREAALGRPLTEFALGYLHYGLHRQDDGWRLCEWAPNASEIYLVGEMSDWQLSEEFRYQRADHGDFVLQLATEALQEGQLCRLWVRYPGGEGWRLPAYSRYVVQDPQTKIFTMRIDNPQQQYRFQHPRPTGNEDPLIYEAHIGMAQEHDNIGSYTQFREHTLPYIAKLGYNTLQLMAIQEHPYYGSFGYHVSNLFAVSSRFGSIDDFKMLVDAAHGLGMRVIIDLVHSHAVRNEEEGLAALDGSRHQYFHQGDRGVHQLWDSYLYNYGKDEVLHLLLSNLRFFLDVYQVDGFRFDGVTSMLYLHHGQGKSFTSYDDYFDQVDEQAVQYLYLANRLIHQLHPQALTIAEDVSGMPGLANRKGVGFDYRMAMGVSDCWFKLLDLKDEDWNIDYLWHELTNARADERTISYVECHDQSLVGGKTFFFTLTDQDAYFHMHHLNRNGAIDRALALHKLARLATMSTANGGYLNFIGNEFGHPEWIDFPRAGNQWSYQHARRLWSLCFQPDLCYKYLHAFDQEAVQLLRAQQLYRHPCSYVYRHNDDKVFSFFRSSLLLAFNFHWQQSLTGYRIPAPPGSYRLVLSSDAAAFGGFDRVRATSRYFSVGDGSSDWVELYLPSRCALVLEKID